MSESVDTMTENGVFAQTYAYGHEQVVFCSDPATGLKAVIGIHNTVLGPALGGTRRWQYATEAEAVRDALRLSRGMTYKNAAAGLNLGGGKAVIIGDPREPISEARLRAFGKCIKNLNGKYITAEDVGMTTEAMEFIALETSHVAGMPISRGGSGDPSPFTALGVYCGMKAAAKKAFGSDSLTGKTVSVQGVGHVGTYLIEHLVKEGADVVVCDVFEDRVKETVKRFGIRAVHVDDIYDTPCDIYAPCALGATVNDETLSRLNCAVIAGAANNQLADESIHGAACIDKGIVYVPDFLINAGGVINIATEVQGNYNAVWATQKVEALYDAVSNILDRSAEQKQSAQSIAIEFAEERIRAIAGINAIY